MSGRNPQPSGTGLIASTGPPAPLHYVPCRYEERTGRSDEGGDDEERDGTGRVSVSSRLLRLRLTIRDECNEVRRKTVGM